MEWDIENFVMITKTLFLKISSVWFYALPTILTFLRAYLLYVYILSSRDKLFRCMEIYYAFC